MVHNVSTIFDMIENPTFDSSCNVGKMLFQVEKLHMQWDEGILRKSKALPIIIGNI